MKNIKNVFVLAALTFASGVASQNPVVQTWFTTDPAPLVHNDTLYLYTGHDWYVCLHSKLSNAMAIGVAVGDSPTGPFHDAIGKPLYDGSWDYIDPTVFIDDDGRAYLYWGNPNIYFAELNEDMVSIKGEVKKLEQTVESFGAPNPENRIKGQKYKDTYTEGPWFYKRNGKYYLLYAAGGVPEHIAYSMGDSPAGPWKYMGEIMPLQDTGSFTNHCGVADYKGNSYFFYHTGKLPGGGGFGRSVAIEEFKYNPDGTFPIINATKEGVKPVSTFNPYRRVEAETIAFSEGVKSEPNAKTGVYISEIHNGDYIKVREVDFGKKGPKSFRITAASALRGGTIEVRTDSIAGNKIAEKLLLPECMMYILYSVAAKVVNYLILIGGSSLNENSLHEINVNF